ncbi:MAG: hypothetical protein WA705_06600 [Candidatus Ozemobacteraceae bacterium]
MKCDFLDRFYELPATEFRAAVSKKEHADHISACKVCAKAVKTRFGVDEALTGLSPDTPAIGRMLTALTIELSKSPRPLKPEKFSFLSPQFISIIIFSVLAITGIVVGILVFDSNNEAQVSRNQEQPGNQPQSMPVIAGRILASPNLLMKVRKDENSVLDLTNGREVAISGAGSLHVSDSGDIIMHDGKLRMAFSHSPRGYKIVLPTVFLMIRGTTIETEISGECQIVRVIEGNIDWTVSSSKEHGELRSGEGIQVKGVRVDPLEPMKKNVEPTNMNFPEMKKGIESNVSGTVVVPGVGRVSPAKPKEVAASATSSTVLGTAMFSASGTADPGVSDNHTVGGLDDGF